MNREGLNNVDEALTNPNAKRMSDSALDQEYAGIEADGFRREEPQKPEVRAEITPVNNSPETQEVNAFLDELDEERGHFNNVDEAVDRRHDPNFMESGFDTYEQASYIDRELADVFENMAQMLRQKSEVNRNKKAGETALRGTERLETQPATTQADANEQEKGTSIETSTETGSVDATPGE
ncbi:hypothetical protein IJH01_00850 [Candidatus Saccharibacteria bacterium]|nr:hypothetical protein [Candidatus Saccharibacteria bacterium]